MTSKIILINGLLPYESGKTWFTISLYKTLMKSKVKSIMYKPVAAHNLWYSVKPLAHSIKLRLLLGNDAYAYYKETRVSPTILNPIAMASAPLDPEKYGHNIEKYMEDSTMFLPQLVMARVSNPAKDRTIHYIVRENVEKTISAARKVIDLLEKTLAPIETSLGEMSRFLTSREIDDLLQSTLTILQGEYDVVLLESFNDAIVPSMGLINSVDLMITIAPGKAFLYDKESSKRIIKYVQEEIKDPGSLIVSNVFVKFRPSHSFNIPLLTKPVPREEFKTISQFLTKWIQ
ncbi:MAG: hypothetical protein QW794_03575 [Thermosphaera sp.]